MKIFLVGATGRAGSWLLNTALNCGHQVTALVREPIERVNAHSNLSVIGGDLFDIKDLSEHLLEHDVIVSSLSSKSVARGTEIIVKSAQLARVKRFIGIAGGGILQLDEKLLRRDRDNYPTMFRESSAQHLQAWKNLEQSALTWTLFCTGDLKNSEATGNAELRVDYMPPGKNFVALGDLASHVMRELEQGEFLNKRVGCTEKL